MKVKKKKRFMGFFGKLSAMSFELSASSGFTIIETLVAISVLLLAITAPLAVAERGLASAVVARQEITAFYLAQEAIEYIRNVRDSNALAGKGGKSNWLHGLEKCVGTEGCGIDATAEKQAEQIVKCDKSDNNDCSVTQYTANNDPNVCKLSPLCGLFGHHRKHMTGWTETGFVRKAFLKEIEVEGENDEVHVQVTVSFDAGTLSLPPIAVSENLLNWYSAK